MSKKVVNRKVPVCVRLSPSEVEQLHALAHLKGVSAGVVVGELIQYAYDDGEAVKRATTLVDGLRSLLSTLEVLDA